MEKKEKKEKKKEKREWLVGERRESDLTKLAGPMYEYLITKMSS